MSSGMVIFMIFIGIVALVFLVIIAKFFRIWLQAYMSNAGVTIFDLIGMTLRKVNMAVIVRAKIMGVQAGITLETKALEAHYLAGGTVLNVVGALIAADRAGIDLDYRRATGIDLAGRDVLDAVRTSVKPKVIDCPDPSKGKDTVDAVAMDGIQVKAKARVTVRMNIDQLIGGATEETIIARVGEGVVTTIGSALTFKKVLENPDSISQTVLTKGLDAGTAFEILSIDIADVDVGENIGARLQAEQAAADLRVAQARAEERRAMAVAREQEMSAEVRENRAKVVLAEAEVPKAIAQAFREGNLGLMDYYSLRNIQADTQMRTSIAGGPTEAGPKASGGEGR